MNKRILSQDEIDALLRAEVDEVRGGLSPGDLSSLRKIAEQAGPGASMAIGNLTRQRMGLTVEGVEEANPATLQNDFAGEHLVLAPVSLSEGLVGRFWLIVPGKIGWSISQTILGQNEAEISWSNQTLQFLSEAMSQLVTEWSRSASKQRQKRIRARLGGLEVSSGDELDPSALELDGENIVRLVYKATLGELDEGYLHLILPVSLAQSLLEAPREVEPPVPLHREPVTPPKLEPTAPPVQVKPVEFTPLAAPEKHTEDRKNLSLLMDIPLRVTVELGRTEMVVKEILSLGSGSVIELDKLAGEPVDVLVNGKLIAKGEVVVIDEAFGVKINDIVSPLERVQRIK